MVAKPGHRAIGMMRARRRQFLQGVTSVWSFLLQEVYSFDRQTATVGIISVLDSGTVGTGKWGKNSMDMSCTTLPTRIMSPQECSKINYMADFAWLILITATYFKFAPPVTTTHSKK